jgi:acyl-coenzyme A synthetase/AMP-(fatty) acid ligase
VSPRQSQKDRRAVTSEAVGVPSWTRDGLAHFKRPADASFAASLARTASGKLQKRAIRASLSSVAVQ